jgi:site-specific DNA-methyltransferase (adenine-specific)
VALALNSVYQGDCIDGLAKIEPGTVDLAFADPPFNIGYEYDVYVDSRSSGDYVAWTRKWMSGVWRALKANGTFWLAIGDEYVAELKIIAQNEIGFSCRSWVIWYYTFGVNCTRVFNRSHTHLLYFVKDPKNFTFNADNPIIRVPSARELVYADGRANPRGRLPDNTWILRPQDVPGGFSPNGDTWYFARVAGTFKEREGFHGCQMPEQLLGRIIRCCSNPTEVVLDPFGGSGTTFTVAKKLGRQWIGFELSADYAERIRTRVRNANVGDVLDGPADPLASAPPTALGKRRQTRLRRNVTSANGAPKRGRSAEERQDINKGIIDAYQTVGDGWSADHLLAKPDLNAAFVDACARKGLPGDPGAWNLALLGMRKAGELPPAARRLQTFTREEMDPFSFASEIAVRQLSDRLGATLDTILCSPRLAAMFDEIAATYAPGFKPFDYRWAAFTLRKRASAARKLASDRCEELRELTLPRALRLSTGDFSRYACPGVYVLNRGGARLYVGDAHNLCDRVVQIAGTPSWLSLDLSSAKLIPMGAELALAFKSFLIHKYNPIMNYELFVPHLDGKA